MNDNINTNDVREAKPKRRIGRYILLFLAVAAVIVGANSFFILYEGESAFVQRFGRIEGVYVLETNDSIKDFLERRPEISLYTGTGLKLKMPFIDNVIKYPSRLILYDPLPQEVLTLDRHRLYFDNTAQWRIENPILFYEAFKTIDVAKERIDDELYSQMRIGVGRLNSYTLISDRTAAAIMLEEITEAVNTIFYSQGVFVADIRVKRTDMPNETYASIYNRMNTERQRVAAENRSQGDKDLLEIRSETDRAVTSIISEAERKAEEIRGEGDSEAARIYNEAYSRDPEFFEFYNLLDTYRITVGSQSTLVVPIDSPFAKYLLGIKTPLDDIS